MVPYTTSNVAPLFTSASALTAFANDCATNWMNAWTSRFILGFLDIDTLDKVPAGQRMAFVGGLQDAAVEVAAGRPIDTSGLNVSGGGHWVIHLNTINTGGLFPLISIWWVHIP